MIRNEGLGLMLGLGLSLIHTSNSVDEFSPPGKCDRMNDMQKT
jgi:hypothetical protein